MDIVLICYAVDNRVSFYNIKSYWFHKIHDIPIFIVGLKIDLRYKQEKNSPVKMISYQEGQKLAETLNCQYLEFCQTNTQKQEKENIEQIFISSIEYYQTQKNKNEKSNKKKSCLIQ